MKNVLALMSIAAMFAGLTLVAFGNVLGLLFFLPMFLMASK